jgi:hypothetical protein
MRIPQAKAVEGLESGPSIGPQARAGALRDVKAAAVSTLEAHRFLKGETSGVMPASGLNSWG